MSTVTLKEPTSATHSASSGRAGIDPAGPEAPPVASPLAVTALTIPITALIAHPGNVRTDIKLTADFLASVKAEGIRVPLLITETDKPGVFRIIDGHRRLAAARKAKLEAVPYTFDAARAADVAGQYLDMIITSRHKAPLSALEEANALFAAEQAGASTQRLTKAYGSREKVTTALKVAKLPKSITEQAASSAYPWTLDELAALDEFADDPEATASSPRRSGGEPVRVSAPPRADGPGGAARAREGPRRDRDDRHAVPRSAASGSAAAPCDAHTGRRSYRARAARSLSRPRSHVR